MRIMNAMNRKRYDTALENMKPEPGDSIPDIGLGNGYLIKKLPGKNIPAKPC